jgi:glycosyltransferase involved in cell wall biosynthesis
MHVIEAMHRGGAESLVIEHVRHARPGIETWVVAMNRGGPAFDDAVAAGAHGVVLGKGSARLGGLRRLAGLMREHRIDAVNGHNPSGGLYGALAARAAGVAMVVRTEHSFHYPGRGSRAYALWEPIATALTRHIVCVCEAARRSHVERLPWAAGRFVTILNGISDLAAGPARAEVRRRLGLGDGERVVLTIGSLTPQKAQDLLIQAWARRRGRSGGDVLLLAGEGPLRDSLEARVTALGLGGSVRFLGPRSDVPDLMVAADVFALSSVREGLSVTLLEAMRAGRPCVATRVGGNGEAIEDGVTGSLVPSGDPDALAAAFDHLLGDPVLRASMGRAARDRWERDFTAERMVRETEALYGSSPPGADARASRGAGAGR